MPQPGTKHLTKAQKSRVAELHQAGRATADIAAELGCTVHQARHALRSRGLKPSGGKGGACYRNADLLRELAAQGVTLSEMARRAGTHHMKVRLFLRKHGIAYTPWSRKGAGNPAWKGGRHTDKHGYVLLLRPDHPAANQHGYVREHRLVMEEKLGRPLSPQEVVHHKDGDPHNNDPENLEIFGSNAKHLAETLKGRKPRWSEDGRRRIRERRNPAEAPRREPTREASSPGGPPSPETNSPTSG